MRLMQVLAVHSSAFRCGLEPTYKAMMALLKTAQLTPYQINTPRCLLLLLSCCNCPVATDCLSHPCTLRPRTLFCCGGSRVSQMLIVVGGGLQGPGGQAPAGPEVGHQPPAAAALHWVCSSDKTFLSGRGQCRSGGTAVGP